MAQDEMTQGETDVPLCNHDEVEYCSKIESIMTIERRGEGEVIVLDLQIEIWGGLAQTAKSVTILGRVLDALGDTR